MYSSETGRSYRLDRLIGKGGFGEVYAATPIPSEGFPAQVCVKISDRLSAWLREAYFAELLAREPRALRVFDRFAAAKLRVARVHAAPAADASVRASDSILTAAAVTCVVTSAFASASRSGIRPVGSVATVGRLPTNAYAVITGAPTGVASARPGPSLDDRGSHFFFVILTEVRIQSHKRYARGSGSRRSPG